MKKNRKIYNVVFLLIAFGTQFFSGCTKVQNGFLSPYVQYAVNEFSIIRGRTTTSYSLVTDGSSIPLHIKMLHIYDSTGNIVDDIFLKKYWVPIWTAGYDPTTDKTYAAIMAKRSFDSLPPIVINEANGTIEANPGTTNLPVGNYKMDLQITNTAGTEQLKDIMNISIVDGKFVETTPEQGNFSNSLLKAFTASGAGASGGSNGGTLFNGTNNPFDDFTITRFADTPNIFILKIVDKNGVPFNPANGEVAKRPYTTAQPFLQNLEDFASDTYATNDTSLSVKFPLVPFPINSGPQAFNEYYKIPSQYVHIDSTSTWSSNGAGNFYQGISDSHFLGYYTDGNFDYAIRFPLRIFYGGSYELTIKLLNATHR